MSLHADTLEQTLLASLLYNKTDQGRSPYWQLAARLEADHFWREHHRHLWRAIDECADKHGEIFVGGVKSILHADDWRHDKLENGVYLDQIEQHAPFNAQGAQSLFDDLFDLYRKRRIRDAARRTAEQLDNGDVDADLAADQLHDATRVDAATTVSRSARELTEAYAERLARDGRVATVPTGTSAFDQALFGGLTAGRFYLLAARPKHGKTKVALSMVAHLVDQHDFTADIWYTDGVSMDVYRELLARKAEVSTRVLQNAEESDAGLEHLTRHGDDTLPRAKHALETIRDDWSNRLQVYAKASPDPDAIRAHAQARAATAADGKYICVVDYLQNCDAGHSGPNADRLNTAAASRALCDVRSETGGIVLGLAQFNRKAAESNTEPKSWHLKASGQLEQDVNHLIIWHRPHFEDGSADTDDTMATFDHVLSKHSGQRTALIKADLATNRFTRHPGSHYG
jgi:replicative DNA helicase